MECGVSMEPTDAGYTPAMTMGDCKSAVGNVVALVINRAKFTLASFVLQTWEVQPRRGVRFARR